MSRQRSSSSYKCNPNRLLLIPRVRVRLLRVFVSSCSAFCLSLPSLQADELSPVRAKTGMVASSSDEASRAGVEIMQQGGNAVDSAVAVGFALAVTLPEAGNLGGGGFMLIRRRDGRATFLDFREKAPAAARPDMYLDAQGHYVKGSSVVGGRAIGVPGSVAGLIDAEQQFGRLTLAQVMAPAIRLAQEGFILSAELARSMAASLLLTRFPESRRLFQRGGDYYRAGERFREPELARTLRRISDGGVPEFYRGALARELAAAIRRHGGLVTEADLRGYEVKTREPLVGSYRGYEIITAPPPSSGGVALLESLNILEGTGYAAGGPGAAESIHWMAEAMRRAFADRAERLGDPDFVPVPVRELTSKAYATRLRAGIDPQAATASAGVQSASLAPAESSQTTHFSIVDGEGNAVACTTTLNGAYGSGVTADSLGFLLNNEMDDFTAAPGVPNAFKLIQGKANEIRPGKRPLSSMAPTILTRDGKLFLVLGSPGGPRIISTVLQVIANVVDFHENVQQAVDGPRFHHQWLPDLLYVERRGFTPEALAELRRRGYEIEPQARWSDAQAIMIDPETGERLGGGDGRHSARPIGY
jgi:gamma-glutamyltranspeptidase/glutathione hydrolase